MLGSVTDRCGISEGASQDGRDVVGTRLAVLPAPLHYRQLQRLVTQSFRKFPSFDAKVSLDVGAKKDLEWWAQNITTWNGQNIHPKPTDVRMKMDASKVGWGAICEEAKTGGHWSPQERCLYINYLELQAGPSQ